MPFDTHPTIPVSTTGAGLSLEQRAIALAVEAALQNILVVARAGTGKTYTIIKCLPLMRGQIAIAAYNTDIAKEIAAKVAAAGLRAEVATFHSFGWQTLRRAMPQTKIAEGNEKWRRIAEDLQIPNHMRSYVQKALGLAKQRGFGVLVSAKDLANWTDLADHYDLDSEIAEDNVAVQIHGRAEVIRQCLRHAYAALVHSKKIAHEIIDYDDMLWLPLILNAKFRQYDWVCVDEAQDSNPVRREIARRMTKPKSGRMFWVGDNCQPLGTKVLVPVGPQKRGTANGKRGARFIETKQIDIEDLRPGDRVISYEPRDCAFRKSGRAVLGVTRRPYTGDLIVVRTPEGGQSKYTPSHICYVNFNGLRDKWAVYAMRKGNCVRIGKCRMDYTHSSGLSARLHHERGDGTWLLSLHETEEEAFYTEQAVSGRFGLPQIMFSPKKCTRNGAEERLTRAWEFIGSNLDRGIACLLHFGRNIDYPLFERGTSCQQTIKRPFLTRACNIMPGVMVLPYGRADDADVHVRSSDWRPVQVSREPYEGDVVSLSVEGSKLYIADNILTHNCQAIYGFTGADNNSLETIARDFNCRMLPMTTTFRCGKAIAALAAQIVPDYRAADTNPEGVVRTIKEEEFDTLTLGDGDAVICRNTKPLVVTAYKLIRRGIPCYVEGRDIGLGLLRMIDRFPHLKTIPALLDKLTDYAVRETAKLMQAEKEQAAESITDRLETIQAIAQGLPQGSRVEDLRAKIADLFQDTPKKGEKPKVVRLLTAHRSKGLEFNRVFGLGVKRYMPSRFAVKDWQVEQEVNLEYVLKTRAINEYVDVEVSE